MMSSGNGGGRDDGGGEDDDVLDHEYQEVRSILLFDTHV
jgi:acylglycerol lipase